MTDGMRRSIDTDALGDDELLVELALRVKRSQQIEADLIELLAEVDARKLHLGRGHSSLFAYCTGELGFSEDVTLNRIVVARAGRRFPRVIEVLRAGQIHLSGLRLLVPVLTDENVEEVLAACVGKSKRQIEELVAARCPRPAVPDSVRRLPERASTAPVVRGGASTESVGPASSDGVPLVPAPAPSARRASVTPLSAEQFKVQFTADRGLREKIEQAQALLRHQVPDGSLSEILDRALAVLIEKVTKERFAVGRRARKSTKGERSVSRRVPAAVRRAVYERDGGRCAFVDERGKRCESRSFLELEHVDGFARTEEHSAERMCLLCREHNQYQADLMYGRAFMDRKRRAGSSGTVKLDSCGDAP